MIKKLFIVKLLIIVIFIICILFFMGKKQVYISQKIFYRGAKNQSDMNTIWCGTFQLAWNELINIIGKDIEFENYNSELVTNLNEKNFTKEMLSENSYYIKVDETSPKLKREIIQDVKNKFGDKNTQFLDNLKFENTNGITIYATLNKKFEFLEKFDDLKTIPFGNTEKKVRNFGITGNSDKALYKNVEVMFYGWNEKELEYAVKLSTKENEEIILSKINSVGEFIETYNRILELEKSYEDLREMREEDILLIPYLNLNLSINYDELCGKEIKGTRKMDNRRCAKCTVFYEF